MENLFKLPMVNGTKVRILQITDSHLFTDKNQTLLGVNTAESYHAVLAAIVMQQHHCDLIIASGDLAQTPSVVAYQRFAAGVSELAAPCVWLPGNHDDQSVMVKVLEDAGIVSAKQVMAGNDWQILLLDSQVVGQSYGNLSEHQLLWLEHCLQTHPQRYALVTLHHHPLACGCSWLDQISLRNASQLAEILMRYPRVTTLLCGHIHQELEGDWYGRRLLASPSTSVQFKPNSLIFTLDNLAPGWRYIDLQPDGSVATEVCRLADGEFCPDINSDGY